MKNEEHEYIVHTVHDNTKNTQKELQKLTELLNGSYETMMTFGNGKDESYFLLYKHNHFTRGIVEDEATEEKN